MLNMNDFVDIVVLNIIYNIPEFDHVRTRSVDDACRLLSPLV